MPPPPRQTYAFASSNPSAASSSQNQFYNRQQQRQPPSAPRRGYTAAPGAASAVSLLPPGQRTASSDSVVRFSFHPIIPAFAHTAPYFSLFPQHANPFNSPARGSVHTISDKVRNILEVDITRCAVQCCHSLRGRYVPLDAQDQDNHPRCHLRPQAHLVTLGATLQVSPRCR